VKWVLQNFSPWFDEINPGGAMSKRPSHFNPYSVLGIQQDASNTEIEKAHRQKLIEAQYSASISVKHVEAAYLVLIDPDERQRLDKKLNHAALNEINAGGAMRKRRSHINPYSVLGIQQDASTAEIERAYRQKLIEAQYSTSISVKHVEAAYLVLVDPDDRRRLDKKLSDVAFNNEYSTKDTDPKVKSHLHPKERKRQRRMALLAGVLLAVLAFSSYFFVLRGGEICPLCHRKSAVETGRTGSRVTLSCTRKSCDFSFEYDRAVDLAHDPDED
jgi:ssDNA-binding Zn-finger/Zn-ribbon topoisomerase 1